MKRKLAVFAITVLCLAVACVFIACNHEHHTDGGWQSDANEHWKVCVDDNEKFDVAPHDFDGDTCKTCGYKKAVVEQPHVHNYDGVEWTTNESSHWKACKECGYIEQYYGAHSYNALYECTVCGYKHEHDFVEEYVCDDVDHWYVAACEHDITSEKAAHTFENGRCTVCGYTDGLQYVLSSDGKSYTVTGLGSVTLDEVVIPSLYKTIPVTAIGDNAFGGKTITSVTIPDSVTTVAENAFEGCPLTEASLPVAAIAAIPKDKLTSVKITSGTGVQGAAFSEARSLKSVSVFNGVTNVNAAAFDGCPIEYAEVPASAVPALPKTSLTTVYIIGGALGTSVFDGYVNLTEVTIDESVTNFGTGAFDHCEKIAKVNYTGSIENWCKISFADSYANPLSSGADLYIGGEKVETLVLPETVTSLNGHVFRGANIKEVRLPDKLTVVQFGAFENCTLLESVVIPASVTKILSKAFLSCSSLDTIYFKGTQAQWNAISIDYNNNVLKTAKVYIFSETEPQGEGNFWHYVEGVPTQW